MVSFAFTTMDFLGAITIGNRRDYMCYNAICYLTGTPFSLFPKVQISKYFKIFITVKKTSTFPYIK